MDTGRDEVHDIGRGRVRVTGQQEGDPGLGAGADELVPADESGQMAGQDRMVGDQQSPRPGRSVPQHVPDDGHLPGGDVAGLPPPCGHGVEPDGDQPLDGDDRVEVPGDRCARSAASPRAAAGGG